MIVNSPLNLAFRFFLEMAALIVSGLAAWHLASGAWSWVAAIVLPLVMAIFWGVFNVPDDPSRGGGAPIPVSGRVRLLVEFGFFAVAVATAWLASMPVYAVTLGVLVVLHYSLSPDRISWLLDQR